MRINKLFVLLSLPVLLLSSCVDNFREEPPAEVSGYVPVYGDPTEAKIISAVAPRPTVKGGKIYTLGNLLFQVEVDSGIHVINYANPQQPQKLGFIKSYLCKEVSVKNGFIYTNNLSDLVVIDINNMNNVREVGRTAGVFPDLAMQYPPQQGMGRLYFVCPDPNRYVVSWKLENLKEPKCWR